MQVELLTACNVDPEQTDELWVQEDPTFTALTSSRTLPYSLSSSGSRVAIEATFTAFISLFLLAPAALLPAAGSFLCRDHKVHLITCQVIKSVHESARGRLSRTCCQLQNVDVKHSSRPWMQRLLIRRRSRSSANTQPDKKHQHRGDVLSAGPDWGLERSGKTQKALKMSHSESQHITLREILLAASFS